MKLFKYSLFLSAASVLAFASSLDAADVAASTAAATGQLPVSNVSKSVAPIAPVDQGVLPAGAPAQTGLANPGATSEVSTLPGSKMKQLLSSNVRRAKVKTPEQIAELKAQGAAKRKARASTRTPEQITDSVKQKVANRETITTDPTLGTLFDPVVDPNNLTQAPALVSPLVAPTVAETAAQQPLPTPSVSLPVTPFDQSLPGTVPVPMPLSADVAALPVAPQASPLANPVTAEKQADAIIATLDNAPPPTSTAQDIAAELIAKELAVRKQDEAVVQSSVATDSTLGALPGAVVAPTVQDTTVAASTSSADLSALTSSAAQVVAPADSTLVVAPTVTETAASQSSSPMVKAPKVRTDAQIARSKAKSEAKKAARVAKRKTPEEIAALKAAGAEKRAKRKLHAKLVLDAEPPHSLLITATGNAPENAEIMQPATAAQISTATIGTVTPTAPISTVVISGQSGDTSSLAAQSLSVTPAETVGIAPAPASTTPAPDLATAQATVPATATPTSTVASAVTETTQPTAGITTPDVKLQTNTSDPSSTAPVIVAAG